MTFTCQQCAWCCRNLPIAVSASDIMRWSDTRRHDILRQVSWINNYPKKNSGGFYIAKTAKFPKQPCPFLTVDNLCSIHETKPRCCRDYPQANMNKGKCPSATDFIDYQLKRQQHDDFLFAFRNWQWFTPILTVARREQAHG